MGLAPHSALAAHYDADSATAPGQGGTRISVFTTRATGHLTLHFVNHRPWATRQGDHGQRLRLLP
jgi:hypothetical protein